MNEANRLAFFDQPAGTFVSRSGEKLVTFERGFDYAMIQKVRPSQFPHRVWLMCAGLGEWSTSGAAWFLANKWNEIRKKAGGKPFAAIIRVKDEQDESATMVRIVVDGPKSGDR